MICFYFDWLLVSCGHYHGLLFFYWMSWCHSLCVYEYFYFGWTLFMVCYTLIEFRVMWSFSRCSWLLLHWLIGCVIWYIILLLLLATLNLIECLCFTAILLLLMATFTLIECLCYLAIHFLCKACSVVILFYGHSFVVQGLLCYGCLCCVVIYLLCNACSVVVACV